MSMIHQPHDRFFKASLKEKAIAIDFFKAHLPADLYQQLEVSTLQAIDKSYVSQDLKEIQSDMVFSCKISGKLGYLPILFLIEHFSSATEHIAFRFLEYSVPLMRDHLKAGHKKLPLVLPIAVYHGVQSPYPYSTDLYEEFEDPNLARSLVFKPFQLIDLTSLPLETLKQHGVVSLMEISLQQSVKKAFFQVFQSLAEEGLLKHVIQHTTESYLTTVLEYVLSQEEPDQPKAADELIQLFLKALPDKREVVMTFADQLENRGVEKGLLQGMKAHHADVWRASKLEAARNLQAEGLTTEFIKKITGLTDKDLLALSGKWPKER
jgi:predicted transposase/invertase (TIGR01784 family)